MIITYLKDKTELFLLIKPNGTTGSHCIYRRSPGDAGMHLRIDSLLDICGILRSDLEIWVILYPPEIHTTTFYVPTGLSKLEISNKIHEQILFNNPYFIHYDWNHFLIKRRDNGDRKDMITVAFVGRDVLPRIRSLLYRDHAKVSFLGDGLQFLAVDDRQIPDIRGRTYEIVLPYGETYYKAVFRSGIHFESVCHPRNKWSPLGNGKLCQEQVYLRYDMPETNLDMPMLLPLVHVADWKSASLTPAAFPLWYIAGRSLQTETQLNFARIFHELEEKKEKRSVRKQDGNFKLLD